MVSTMSNSSVYPNSPGYKIGGTSQRSAERIQDRAEIVRAGVLRCLGQHKDGMTADEIAEALDVNFLSVRPRCSELRRTGHIKDSGLRRTNASGHRANVWTLVTEEAQR